jgi:hypothetical protein
LPGLDISHKSAAPNRQADLIQRDAERGREAGLKAGFPQGANVLKTLDLG